MYKNIGRKIKAWAKVVCILGIVFSCLTGLILIAAGLFSFSVASRYDSAAASVSMIVAIIGGVVIAGLGSLFSWLSTFLLYGFGHQVDMQEKSALALEDIQMLLRSQAAPQPSVKPAYVPAPQPVRPAPAPVAPPAPKPVTPPPAPAAPAAPAEPAPAAPAEPVCAKCGTKLSKDAAFCPNCGSKV